MLDSYSDLKSSNIGYGLFQNKGIINDSEIYLLDFWNSRNFLIQHYKEDEEGKMCNIGKLHYEEKKYKYIFGTYSLMSE